MEGERGALLFGHLLFWLVRFLFALFALGFALGLLGRLLRAAPRRARPRLDLDIGRALGAAFATLREEFALGLALLLALGGLVADTGKLPRIIGIATPVNFTFVKIVKPRVDRAPVRALLGLILGAVVAAGRMGAAGTDRVPGIARATQTVAQIFAPRGEAV